MSLNGQRPEHAASSSKRVGPLTRTLPISVRAALILLWLGHIDADNAAIDRALAMLPEDREVRAIAAALCEIGVAAEPRLRCAASRDHMLDLLATVDVVFRTLTGREQ